MKLNTTLRALGEQYQQERADHMCLHGVCDHQHPAIAPLPGGVIATLNTDYVARLPLPRGHRVLTLVRFAKREWGGWRVQRADNGRDLGWVVRCTSGKYAGLWSAHVTPAAFRGAGPDDEGALLDRVPAYLYNGEGDSNLVSRSIGHYESRSDAADAVVGQLVREHAPAVGYERHHRVVRYYVRSGQHFPLGEGREEHCCCGKAWPGCPDRAELLAAEAVAAR